MNLSHKLTISLILVLLAFVAVPVMAHELDPNVEPHVNADPDTTDTPGTDHALVRSIVVNSMYLTPKAPITVTITFADGVAAIADDTSTDVPDGASEGDTTNNHNEGRHAILSDPAADLATAGLALQFGTRGSDGTYTWAAADGTNGVQINNVIKTTVEGAGATGSGSVYTVYLQVPTDLSAADDGKYRIFVLSTSGIINPGAGTDTNDGDAKPTIKGEFTMDTTNPTITSVGLRAIGQNYANADGEWSDPFEIIFDLEDPIVDDDDPMTEQATGLKLSTLMFEVKDDMNKAVVANELMFSDPQFTGQNEGKQYVVTATPTTSATAVKPAKELRVTVKVMDMAGNEGKSTDDLDGEGGEAEARPPLTVKLASRAATGTDPGPGDMDTTKPTVTIGSAAGAANTADADKVIFTFTFTEVLATTGENAFTVTDLNVSNADTTAATTTLTSSDNRIYMLKVTPTNTRFPTKVSFKSDAKVADAAGNLMAGTTTAMPKNGLDATGTYTPAGVLGVEIDAPTDIALGLLTFTFTFAEAPSTTEGDSGQFTVSDIRVSNAEPLVTANLTKQLQSAGDDEVIFELDVTPMDITKPVTVQLKGRSVSNGAMGDDQLIAGEISATWTPPTVTPDVPPEHIMIPANSFVVVVRDEDAMGASGLAFRDDVMVKEWPMMPNLERLFHTGSDGIILGRGGGGALILTQSQTPTGSPAVSSGTVGISEIMWGIDAAYLGEDREDASQWVELHNLNTTPVYVQLSWKTGRDITSDATITGNLAAPKLDVVTNFFNNRPGNQKWQVPGSSGSSITQDANFVSMARTGDFNLTSQDGGQYNKRYTHTGGATKSRDGRHSGSWTASTAPYLSLRTTRTDQTDVAYKYIGTPGRVNSFTAERQPHLIAGRTGVPTSNHMLINEVGNNSNDNYDWIELRNNSGGTINLRNFMISIVTNRNDGSDRPLIQFDNNNNAQVAAGAVILLLRTDPANDPNHPIAATGYNVDKSAQEQQPGEPNSPVRYKVFSGGARGALNLPNDGKFVLILRRQDDHGGQRANAHGNHGVAETGNADLDKIHDVAGNDDDLDRNSYPNPVSRTNVWPLHNFRNIAGFTNNRFVQNTVHQRNRVGTNDGASGVGAQDNNNGKTAFGDVGWTGVGYRRKVANTAMHGGTPGYPNNASMGAGTAITGAVYISEIMYANGARNSSLPQWIEIRNTSNTMGADLHNWRLTIKNHADKAMHEDGLWTDRFESSVLLRGLKIKPNSAVLITSRKGPRQDVHLADNEIFSLWPAHRNDFQMANANDDVINTFGFRITLHANGHEGDRNKWQLVDDVGNLATPDATARSGNNERFDAPRWMWPDANDDRNRRSSVARKNNTAQGLGNGSMPGGWILSSMDVRTQGIDYVYYGHADDQSTPGQTTMSPLPVELSHFRPTLENGKVTIQWTTESELDNAGFNILRSDTRDGEFTQVNEQMIQGKGTTAERSTYKWVDTTAKPGAVYYYQIEDVSFAGEHTKLATTKLKGLISAKGKLTTQWGDLKNLR